MGVYTCDQGPIHTTFFTHHICFAKLKRRTKKSENTSSPVMTSYQTPLMDHAAYAYGFTNMPEAPVALP